MCSGTGSLNEGLKSINNTLLEDPNAPGSFGLKNQTTGEIQHLNESKEQHYKRVTSMRQREADELASQRNAIMEQQRSESQRLQTEMVEQQKQQSKNVAGLQAQQTEKLTGIRSRGQSVVSSLQILGQQQPMAPTASQTASRSSGGRAASTSSRVTRGSARSRGTNLSI